MKRFISVLMAAALIMSLSVSAFAAEVGYSAGDDQVTSVTSSSEKEITYTYSDGTTVTADTVYCIEIAWSDVTAAVYSATGGTIYTWDPDALEYSSSTSTSGSWSSATFTVDVENRSNAGITAEVGYTAVIASTLDIDGSSASLEAADASLTNYSGTGTATNTQFNGTITVTGSASASGGTLGTVTLTISKTE